VADAPVRQPTGQGDETSSVPPPVGEPVAEPDVPDVPPPTEARTHDLGGETSSSDAPMVIPVGLPCAGKPVTALTPPQLRMLLSRVDQLAAEHGSAWRPLLEGLAAERAARIAKGQKRPVLVPVEGDGHGR
jgi:hypothetical protein